VSRRRDVAGQLWPAGHPIWSIFTANYGWDELLWACAVVGMIGGVVGLLALGGAGPRWIALTGGALAILGCLIRIVTSALLIFRPAPDWVALILVSIGLMLVGMTLLGITTLLGKQLRGWRAWTPLAVPVSLLVIAAVYSIDQFVHFILLGFWGIPWLLVGYVVVTQASDLYRQRERGPRGWPEHSVGEAARGA
jgi:hypothetical protein